MNLNDIYSPDEIEWLFNITSKKIGTINDRNKADYERLEMMLEMNETINKRCGSCGQYKGLQNKLTKLIPRSRQQIVDAYNELKQITTKDVDDVEELFEEPKPKKRGRKPKS